MFRIRRGGCLGPRFISRVDNSGRRDDVDCNRATRVGGGVVPPAVVGSGRGVMDHESTGLTETERRILAEIEDGLLHQRRTLWGPRRRRPGPPSTRARTTGWRVVTVLGSTVLAGGLVAG